MSERLITNAALPTDPWIFSKPMQSPKKFFNIASFAQAGETGEYCFYAGGKRVVVAEISWRNFLNGLRKLGMF